jgi:4-amino-4-deoxy-L-arabinose transferase-like glycosyltransferase
MTETPTPAREIGVFLALLALTCALRLPFSENIGADEAFFALIGRDWTQGLLPYADRFDVKPPGLFLLYALIAPLFGVGVAAIKGLEVGFVAASAYGLWRIGARYFSAPVGLAAAALYPLYSLAMSGVNAPAALFLSGFEIFAVLAALKGRAAVAGLLFGCAFAMKQTAAIETAAVLAAVLAEAPARDRWRMAVRFLAGCAAAPAGFAVYFLLAGAFPAFWAAAVVAAGGRLNGDNVGFIEGLARLPGGLKPMMALAAGALLVVLRYRRLAGETFAPALRLVLAWLAGGLAAVIAMRAMYDHYFLPLAPPLLLLSAIALFHALDLGARRRRATVGFAAAAILCPAAFGFAALTAAGEGEDRAALLAAEARAREAGLLPGDVALAVNRGVMFYVDTGARPPGRIFHPQHLLCDFPTLSGDQLALALAARPRFVLLADTRMGMVCEKPERLAALRAVLDRDYQLAGGSSGRWDRYAVYKLK